MINKPLTALVKIWSVKEILLWTTEHFTAKKISSARLDAELLISFALKCKRIDIYLRFDQPLKPEELTQLREFIKRRASFEPIAYILGTQEFYGRPFVVGSGCLIPRPETEHLIDEAIAIAENRTFTEDGDPQSTDIPKGFKILDVATGSGCIAATLALEIPDCELTALDISEEALKYARANFATLASEASKISTVCADFAVWAQKHDHKLEDKFDLIVSNPPYISKNAQLMPDVGNFEPALALFGGDDGIEIVQKWLPQMIGLLKDNGIILSEIGFDQKEKVSEILNHWISTNLQEKINFSFIKDYSSRDRIVKISKSSLNS